MVSHHHVVLLYAIIKLINFRILNPLVFGDYPEVMKKIVGSRLPSFTKYQSKQLKDSFDYIGLNYYTSVYVKDNFNASMTGPRDFNTDVSVLLAS